ncbi:reverse transcriptase domain-containing protein [Tanacetum coccineum]
MINGTLYKKYFLGPWLRCVGPLQANYVLREIHEGSCSMHSGPRSVVAKVIRKQDVITGQTMLWMQEFDKGNALTIKYTVRSQESERTDSQNHSPWPFYKWGIDIAGPFLEGPGKVKFLIVAIDYFTKWIEARLSQPSLKKLLHVLWAHLTMIKSSNGETPFSLTYGTEAVIPAEIGMPTLRTTEIDLTKNNEALGMDLDLIEERMEQAAIQ